MPFAPVLQAHTNLLYNVAKDDAKNQPNALLMKSVLNRNMLSNNKEWNCWWFLAEKSLFITHENKISLLDNAPNYLGSWSKTEPNHPCAFYFVKILHF